MDKITNNKEEQIELLSCDLEGGCSAKIPPDLLEKTLAPIMQTKVDSNLLSDVDIGDDAGVYKISDDNALIFTVDYFPPVIADPYGFGQIAACNSISDVYAMGGEPRLALNITMFPKDDSLNILANILKGGQDKATEAGVLVVGGHTITDTTVKYGMAVIGFANPNKITTNSAAKEGDIIILTKALGTGSCLAAMRQGLVKDADIEDVFESMKTLNKIQILIGFLLLLLTGCKNAEELNHLIYMTGTEKTTVSRVTIDGPQSFGVSATCTAKAEQDLHVSFRIDNSLVDKYNSEKGTNFKCRYKVSFFDTSKGNG